MRPLEKNKRFQYIVTTLTKHHHLLVGDALKISARLVEAWPDVPPLDLLGVDPVRAKADLFVAESWSGSASELEGAANYRDVMRNLLLAASAPVALINLFGPGAGHDQTPAALHAALLEQAARHGFTPSNRAVNAMFATVFDGWNFHRRRRRFRHGAEAHRPSLTWRTSFWLAISGTSLTTLLGALLRSVS